MKITPVCKRARLRIHTPAREERKSRSKGRQETEEPSNGERDGRRETRGDKYDNYKGNERFFSSCRGTEGGRRGVENECVVNSMGECEHFAY